MKLKRFILGLLIIVGLCLLSGQTTYAQKQQHILGDQVNLASGATYYESADPCGSGRSGRVPNHYTKQSSTYYGGYAVLDCDQRIKSAGVYSRAAITQFSPEERVQYIESEPSDEVWYFVYVDGFTTGSLGWFPAEAVTFSSPVSGNDIDILTPEQAVSGIEDQTSRGEKVALLLDASGSVLEYSEAIAGYGERLKGVSDVWMFAGDTLKIAPVEYREKLFELDSNGTSLIAAMNNLPDIPYDNVIVVTDTIDTTNDVLEDRTDIERVTIILASYISDKRYLGQVRDKWTENLVVHLLELDTE